MFKIQTLNNISLCGLERLPRDKYEVSSEASRPDAILVRSAPMHDMQLAESLKAIGRAGAGVNNIPVQEMTRRGVAVFNAPGANANAVKELVLAGMLLAARNIPAAWAYVRQLTDRGADLKARVEAGKKQFRGFELPGRTLGVIGLGAIGVKVSNAAQDLGMKVLGYDPKITVENAWRLNAAVEQAVSVDDLFSRSQFISVHVPLLDATRGLVNSQRIGLMKKPGVILNFARGEIVDEDAVIEALDSGQLAAYVCDFPTTALMAHPKVIALPHLGASTAEAEDNCAVMVAEQIREYLEVGNVRNSVNFPEAVLPMAAGVHRLCIANANVPNMVGQITTALARHDLNIADLLNKSRGELAYTLVDVDQAIPDSVVSELSAIKGVLAARVIEAA